MAPNDSAERLRDLEFKKGEVAIEEVQKGHREARIMRLTTFGIGVVVFGVSFVGVVLEKAWANYVMAVFVSGIAGNLIPHPVVNLLRRPGPPSEP